MKKIIFIITIPLFILFNKSLCPAQQIDTTGIRELVPKLIEAYDHFDYEKSTVLLDFALKNLPTFSTQDLKTIYLYGSFLAFRDGNTVLANQYFWDILNIDPTYTLDPVTTPPKLLTLFQKTKIEFLEDLNRRLQDAKQDKDAPPFPWRAVFFPGWEQYHRDYKTKGLSLALGGMVTLTGTIISIIQTNEREKNYQQATDPQTIRSRYDSYQAAYRRQFYFAYAFLGIWAFSQLDLVVWSHPKVRFTPSLGYNSKDIPTLIFNLSLRF